MEGGDALTTAMPPVSALSWSQAPVITSTSTATSSTPSTPNHTPPGTPTTPTPTAASVPTPTVTGSCVPLIPAPSPTGSTGSTSSTGPPPSVVTAKPSKSKKRKIKVPGFVHLYYCNLTLSSLGFFEHSQPGGGGGWFASPYPTITFLLFMQIKWNFAQLLTGVSSTIWWCDFFQICYDVIVML